MSVLARVNALNFIVLGIHQVEEYVLPGGMGIVMNKLQSEMPNSPICKVKGAPMKRYPLNQFNAMVGNCFTFYLIYLLPVFLPDVIWLGLAPVLFGMVFQTVVHCFVGNINLGAIYNPGMGAVLLGHIPLGVYYIWYLTQNGLATSANLLGGIAYLIVFMAVFMGLAYKVLSKPDNSWPFSPEKIARGKAVSKVLFKKIHFDD